MSHPAIEAGEREAVLADARKRFFDKGESRLEGVEAPILRSWLRCKDNGLQPGDPRISAPASRVRLSESRERSDTMLQHASGVMEHVFAQIRNSGSMVILADMDGMIIHSLGDPSFVDKACRVALQPGASWNERVRGTNAIGTAIADRCCVEVYGPEHFFNGNAFLACSAAPVFDAHGRVAGVLDISSDFRSHQRHTLGLVRLSVQLLEKRLFEAQFSGEMVLAFHARPEYLGSLQEAVVALDESGAVIGSNPVAREWLATLGCGGSGVDFGQFFKGRFGVFLDRASASANSPMSIHKLDLRQGGEIYAQLRGARKIKSMKPSELQFKEQNEASTATETVPCAQSGGVVTLECLDTGDERLHLSLERARRVAGKDIPLLVQGESGVGKELFAQAFHNSGPRAKGPFVALNCAAIPETLIESELFGYAGGAFTGARREGAMGRIQQASGGTLFLDEIGDMPIGMQARLLRVLQERCVMPVGSLKAIPVDISLVCATHRNLREAVAQGVFREDLYYRVNGLTVTLPPLRERSDIRGLVMNVLAVECAESGQGIVTICEPVMEYFQRYPWPGNIRQLQNVLRVALALLDDGEKQIRAVHLPEELFADEAMSGEESRPLPVSSPLAAEASANMSRQDLAVAPGAAPGVGRLDEIELNAIRRVMEETGGNISAAARKLGVSRNTLYRKLGRM